MRKKVEKMGSESSSLSKNINAIRRISYITELDYKFCAAVSCQGYPTQEGSPIYNTFLGYFELFFDKTDVIEDTKLYL